MRDKYKLKLFRGRWYITWTGPNGSKRTSTGEKNQDDARRFLEDFLAAQSRPKSVTVEWIWDAYRKEKKEQPVSTRMGHEWKSIGPHFGHLEPHHITVDHCKAYMQARKQQGRKDGTILTELNDLSTALGWAVKRKHIPSAPHIERPAKPASKNRWLTEREISRLIAAAKEHHIKLAILLMLSTAGRKGAILGLTWDQVDMEAGTIDLAADDGKRRKGRAHVTMTRTIRAALQEAKKASLTNHVIEWAGRPLTSIRRGFNKAVSDAGLEGVTPHVLRHTAAVHMAKRGVSMAMIAQFLGHSDDRITQRVYAKFAPEHFAPAADALDDMMRRECAPVQLHQIKGTREEQ